MDINKVRSNIRNALNKKQNITDIIRRKNRKWNRYYQSHEWKQLREWKINNYPICENCYHYGIVIPATEVHHLHVFSDGKTEQDKWKLLLDPYNIRSLCSSCHDLYHNTMRSKHITCITDYIEPRSLSITQEAT